MKALALALVIVEIILCVLIIYLGCVYIRRKQCCERQASANDPHNAGSSGPGCSPKHILVFVSFSAAKASLGKTIMSLTCADCLKVFQEADETLRLMPTCGHVFHPTCLMDPCSPLCPHCIARPSLDGPDAKPEEGKGDQEVLEIKVVKNYMIKLSEEETRKIIPHAKFVLPTGKLCSPAQFLS
ncbi:hypothetical protein BVRB_4g094440 [Beta vulgaris subsp. vulgaris]|uniref:RING-type E3 ubiquitin transferase n=1 Tax=Beta vulgaris subsp. vulgaris TaxID=3555 RepID=A0A0J8BDT4_BETVV|nr:hypothetical protein BVRB_4g094440 [Beta vulgaris subsp. vulgaris]